MLFKTSFTLFQRGFELGITMGKRRRIREISELLCLITVLKLQAEIDIATNRLIIVTIYH